VSSGLYLNALDAIDYDLVNSLYLTLGLLILWSPGISYVYYLLFGLTGVEWILSVIGGALNLYIMIVLDMNFISIVSWANYINSWFSYFNSWANYFGDWADWFGSWF